MLNIERAQEIFVIWLQLYCITRYSKAQIFVNKGESHLQLAEIGISNIEKKMSRAI